MIKKYYIKHKRLNLYYCSGSGTLKHFVRDIEEAKFFINKTNANKKLLTFIHPENYELIKR